MIMFQKNGVLPDTRQGMNSLKLLTNLMCLFTACGVIQYFPLFSPQTIKLNTYFHFFHTQGKALLLFKTWEQEVFLKQPYWGRRQGWPLVPLQFSSALTPRYVQFAARPCVLTDLIGVTWQSAQFSFLTEYFLTLTFRWLVFSFSFLIL